MAALSLCSGAEVPRTDQFKYLKEPFFVHPFFSQMMVLDRRVSLKTLAALEVSSSSSSDVELV
jgi:hypothetical protein